MPALTPADLYEQDFYAWTQAQARELRRLKATRPNLPLDLPHLALEIADSDKDRRDSLRNWTSGCWSTSSCSNIRARDPRRGWIAEVVDFRRDIAPASPGPCAATSSASSRPSTRTRSAACGGSSRPTASTRRRGGCPIPARTSWTRC